MYLFGGGGWGFLVAFGAPWLFIPLVAGYLVGGWAVIRRLNTVDAVRLSWLLYLIPIVNLYLVVHLLLSDSMVGPFQRGENTSETSTNVFLGIVAIAVLGFIHAGTAFLGLIGGGGAGMSFLVWITSGVAAALFLRHQSSRTRDFDCIFVNVAAVGLVVLFMLAGQGPWLALVSTQFVYILLALPTVLPWLPGLCIAGTGMVIGAHCLYWMLDE